MCSNPRYCSQAPYTSLFWKPTGKLGNTQTHMMRTMCRQRWKGSTTYLKTVGNNIRFLQVLGTTHRQKCKFPLQSKRNTCQRLSRTQLYTLLRKWLRNFQDDDNSMNNTRNAKAGRLNTFENSSSETCNFFWMRALTSVNVSPSWITRKKGSPKFWTCCKHKRRIKKKIREGNQKQAIQERTFPEMNSYCNKIFTLYLLLDFESCPS